MKVLLIKPRGDGINFFYKCRWISREERIPSCQVSLRLAALLLSRHLAVNQKEIREVKYVWHLKFTCPPESVDPGL